MSGSYNALTQVIPLDIDEKLDEKTALTSIRPQPNYGTAAHAPTIINSRNYIAHTREFLYEPIGKKRAKGKDAFKAVMEELFKDASYNLVFICQF